ncbi:MAG TPA: amidohydrolase family protein [Methanocorpusculum sp.]|nr:amidohydrolase family protein [Methanocorpusculum sp.]
MKNGMRVIDCENHFEMELMIAEWRKSMTPEAWKAAGNDIFDNPQGSKKEIVDIVMDIDALRLQVMDNAGIDFAQVSLTTPGAEYFPPETGKKIARTYNDILMAAIDKHPDRIGAYMSLYPDDVEWSLNEIDRCAKGGMFGWSTLSNFNGKYLDDPKYFPILEKLASYKMPVYLHPNYAPGKEYAEFGYCINGPSLGFTADTQLLYMRLIHRGIFDKLPDLKVIMGHDCEGMGFFKNRMDTAWRQGMGQPNKNIGVILEHEPSYYLDNNTWGTTSGNYSQIALRATLDAMGKEKMMLGTDFLYEDVKAMVDFIGDNKDLSREEKEAILYRNAEAFGFGKDHRK